ncbi:HD domain-containing protein [Winogradskyella schleiferi]|uniref:HD domain-containing protein n=1 Tax=Winogradskyella schleiferi TaxID=2686078 RepID=UPI001E4CE58D|nr:hypothetical protein [Winogradskyella schleiferi]
MKKWLKDNWFTLASNYTDEETTNGFWKDLETHYTSKNRHYHNLSHLYHMFLQLEDFKTDIKDLDSLKFAIWYHDIIYKATNKDNEEQSAVFAKKRLNILNFEEKRLKNVENLIISTKKHQIILDENNDNAYLLDFDLSILGSDWETYLNYTQQIRKEYKIYPDFMYNPGRRKVLQHFLERETLYFTDAYQSEFENKARENIIREIELL